ncbi:MAG: hypothetical protein QOH13_2214 [Thermoleophilaceae bacterium]|nr:hypothetical protein [Thermoleophilaceae bacterium]
MSAKAGTDGRGAIPVREQSARKTRAKLLSAGLRLAESMSLARISVNLLVREAGVAKGSFFHHFGDRATYLVALHREFHERLLAELQAATSGLPPGRERLETAGNAYLDVCLRERGVRALLLEARAEPLIAEEVLNRNEANAEICRADFDAMGWNDPLQSARLWIAVVAEAALVELRTGGRDRATRRAIAQLLAADRV